MRGEDSASLEKSYQHTRELLEKGDIVGIGARVLFPLAGSRDYQSLVREYQSRGQNEVADGMRTSDYIHPGELQQSWLDHMTDTGIEEITRCHQKIIMLAEEYGVKINGTGRLMFS